MRRVICALIAALLLTGINPGIAQRELRGKCGTEHTDAMIQRLLKNRDAALSTSSNSRVVKYVPVTFHLVANDNGNNRAREEQVLAQIASLNAQYADQEFIFYIDELDSIDLTLLYNDPSHPTSAFQMRFARDQNAMDIYVTLNANNSNEGPGTTLGYYSPLNDWIVMRKSELNGFSSTLAHEAGHFFSLPHPHLGWECEPYDNDLHGNPVSSNFTPCNSGLLVELQNGSNCSNSGDFICDTPPDYNFGFGWSFQGDECAEYNRNIMDPNGDVVDPMETNVMGYFENCDEYMFTNTQKNIMASDFNGPDRSYLRTGNVPNTTPVTEDVSYQFPINDELADASAQLLFDWDDVPGANQYLFMVDRFSTFTFMPERRLISDSEVIIEELQQQDGVRYYWRVWPFNESQTGAGWSATQTFVTGDPSAVKEISSINVFNIYPNPVKGGETFNLHVETIQDFSADIRLIDISGQAVRAYGVKSFEADATNSEILSIHGLSEGIYFVQLISSAGIKTEKLILQ